MFERAGIESETVILDLGDNFDTSNVTSMRTMFEYVGYHSESVTINLGSKFDTSKVADMVGMFANVGYSDSTFTLDLGNKFSVVSIINNSYTSNTFASTGRANHLFKPTAQVKTQAEKDEILSKFPNIEVTIKP